MTDKLTIKEIIDYAEELIIPNGWNSDDFLHCMTCKMVDTMRENEELKECLKIPLHAAKEGNKIHKKSAFVTIAESLLQTNKESSDVA